MQVTYGAVHADHDSSKSSCVHGCLSYHCFRAKSPQPPNVIVANPSLFEKIAWTMLAQIYQKSEQFLSTLLSGFLSDFVLYWESHDISQIILRSLRLQLSHDQNHEEVEKINSISRFLSSCGRAPRPCWSSLPLHELETSNPINVVSRKHWETQTPTPHKIHKPCLSRGSNISRKPSVISLC